MYTLLSGPKTFCFSSVLANGGLPADGSASSSREIQYAVVVDAGSSGSRAYLYSWPEHTGDPRDLLEITPLTDQADPKKPLVKKAVPGISSLQDHPGDALEYITPLLEFAEAHIPSEKLKETPLYILATAGMRLVEKTKQVGLILSIFMALLGFVIGILTIPNFLS